MAANLLLYPHRHNRNDTYDSICLTCFATVATTLTEPELAVYDRKHICNQFLLSERRLFKPPPSHWQNPGDNFIATLNPATESVAAELSRNKVNAIQ
jgi:hypothetical protein